MYASIIIASIIAAGAIFIATRPARTVGIETITEGEQIWVKCTQRRAAYQTGKKQYFEQLQEKAKASSGMPMVAPRLTCRECVWQGRCSQGGQV
jgi:hypothetical protein